MLRAINSVPAYIRRSAIMLVLAPVVQHAEDGTDCQFSSWQNRGWCRLEAVVGSLVGRKNYMILVESSSKIGMFNPNDMLTRDPVGCGSFSCCAQDHVVDIGNGILESIPCDKYKIAAVCFKLFDEQLFLRSCQRDFTEYRWLLGHEPIILRDLPGVEDRRKFSTWHEFAKVFKIDVSAPLARIDDQGWFPLAYATMANNLPVVLHLLSCKADVNQRVFPSNRTFYRGFTPMHIIMRNGQGEDGKRIFDALLDAKADPYAYSYGGGRRGKPTYRDPLLVGVTRYSLEMSVHYMNRVKPNLTARADQYNSTNENFMAMKGHWPMFQEFLKHDPSFKPTHALGFNALHGFIVMPKEYQYATDTRILDVFHERGVSGDLDRTCHSTREENRMLFTVLSIVSRLRRWGFLKNNGAAKFVSAAFCGSAFHLAVYRDKPEVVAWLLNHGADTKRTNRNGQTPLELAQELGHKRCVSILSGDRGAIRRYSTQ